MNSVITKILLRMAVVLLAALALLAPARLRAQTLGDIARQSQAQKAAQPPARPLTNDDISTTPEPTPPAAASSSASASTAAEEAKSADTQQTEADASTQEKKGDEASGAEKDEKDAKDDKSSDGADKPKTKSKQVTVDCAPCPKSEDEAESKKSPEEKRTEEINKHYIDQINGIHEKITKAQEQISRLQRDQAESAAQYRQSLTTEPTAVGYSEQQRVFASQIEAAQKQIETLNSQLEDAREAARHAGVPHATDY